MRQILEAVGQAAKLGRAVVLVSIVEHSGSTPRGAGAKMLVQGDGSAVGTIGGGAVEFEAQRTAQEVLKTKKSCIREFNLSQADVANLGMVCGGQVTVYVQYIDPNDSACHKAYKEAATRLMARKDFVLLTKLDSAEVFVLTPEEERCAPLAYADTNHEHTCLLGEKQYLTDPFCASSRALIFGMGHVGAELVPVLHRIGFYTVAMDDRAEFLTRERLPQADERKQVNFSSPLDDLFVDERDYIVILTRGHMHDYSVLCKAVHTKACYIGLIGSRGKVALSMQKLGEEGVQQTDIARIHAPIGLPLGGRTPEEIAISIAAEMIRTRARYTEKDGRTGENHA